MFLKPPKGSMVNRGHNLSNGLVGCWLMNEGGGNIVFDLSGNSNDGSLVNSPTWKGGKYGSAIETVYANNQAINCGSDIPTKLTGAFTYSFWVKPVDLTVTTYIGLIGGRTLGAATSKYGIGIAYRDDITKFYFQYYETAALKQTQLTRAFDEGIWYHIVWCWSGSPSETMKIYFDGVQESSTTAGQNPADWSGTDGNFYICRDQTRENSCIFDHYMVWNRGLSAAEIASLYREPFQMFWVDM